MAKGAFLGVKRGKLGDAVGYNVANSSDGVKQGWRIYQPVVSNPQTDAQLDQRVKLAVVNNFYRSLKSVITRGWENHKYGDQSRRAFLRAALGSGATIPILPKGTTLAPPLKGVPVTNGSLAPVSVTYSVPNENWVTLIKCYSDDISDDSSVGVISRLFIDAGYQSGDQVTFVLGCLTDNGYIEYRVGSIYLDTTNQNNFTETIGNILIPAVEDNKLNFNVGMGWPSLYSCLLISVSRDSGAQNLRSYAEFAIATALDDMFYNMSGEVTRANAGTYRKSGSKNTDWPQVPTRGGVEPGTTYTIKVADGSTITAASTRKSGDFWVVVADNEDEYWVKCTDVKSLAYNKWLIGKSGRYMGNMWGNAGPTEEVPNDSICPLITSSDATEADLQLYYFLVSQGFDARGLMGAYPAS